MISAIVFFVAGFLLGHLMPRVPFMVLCRTSGFNKGFPPHPEPIPLTPRLTQRVLHMRWFHRLGTYTTVLPPPLRISEHSWWSIHLRIRVVSRRRLDTTLESAGAFGRFTCGVYA